MKQKKGDRALLNLGHTFGHAIETHLGYGNWLHGEAVSTGMMMAAALSEELGDISIADVSRLEKITCSCQFAHRITGYDAARRLFTAYDA